MRREKHIKLKISNVGNSTLVTSEREGEREGGEERGRKRRMENGRRERKRAERRRAGWRESEDEKERE